MGASWPALLFTLPISNLLIRPLPVIYGVLLIITLHWALLLLFQQCAIGLLSCTALKLRRNAAVPAVAPAPVADAIDFTMATVVGVFIGAVAHSLLSTDLSVATGALAAATSASSGEGLVEGGDGSDACVRAA